jgi:hypothetical protein
MNLSNFQSLLTDEGQRALESAMALRPKETDFLRHFTALERRFPREIARAALEIVILRGKATVKFPADAHKLFFTREALEQASSAEVATYRARRFETFELVCDLGCSVADLTSPLPLGRRDGVAVFFDPGRREGESRLRSVRDYQPPLGVIQNWLPHWGDLGVKISPAVRTVELAGYDAEVEFISLGGELKEAVLWFGSLRRGWASRRATVLPGCHTMTGVPDLDGEEPPIAPRLSEPRAYLYEPDAAVIRAGLVRTLGAELDATQLDADIAFLTSDRLIETPFAEALAVEDWLPFNVKRLRAYLRDRNVGSVTVKKRGSPVDTEKLARDLKRRGQEHRLVVLTQLDDKPIVIICR